MPVKTEFTELQVLKRAVLDNCTGKRADTTRECIQATLNFWDKSKVDEWYYIQSLWYNQHVWYVILGPIIGPIC